ncbi:ABC transporter permease [Kosmotoga pacifica]|uniref:Peptide ABC transporter permease n=1 Tax=Kosmotoga pacifica TaxID=1330330 RepID=A0A0G2Z6D8_9BACT|nr:ABC transporter permease [Kosmotoga pacifica]AKI97165.1 peptide ABC transporter permease [Kosmotoga pacifica]
MTAYIIRRLLLLPLILIGVTLIIFSMIWTLGPERLLASYVKSPEALKTPDAAERLIKKYGLDQPMPVMYGKWLLNVLKGDLGYSLVGKAPVAKAIAERFPYTLELALYAFIPVVFVAIWLGITSAVHQNKFIDQFIRVFALIGWSLPDFVFGLLLLWIFYAVLGWFPPGMFSTKFELVLRSPEWHTITHLPTIDALLNGRFDVFVDALKHLVLPVMTISYLWWAYLLRITRSSMLEVLRKDYIRTARAKGVPEKVVINKHAKRNALIPVVTVAGGTVIGLLSGTVIVEAVFSRTGMGRFLATAATQLDYWSIIGGALFYSFILVLGNLIVDVSYAIIDPRIRLH